MITSTSNVKIKEIVQLQKKGRLRNERGIFLVEGLRMVQEVPVERIVKMYMTEDFYKKKGKALLQEQAMSSANASPQWKGALRKEKAQDMVPGLELELVTPTVFSYMSDTKTPQGVLAVVRQGGFAKEALMDGRDAHLLVLDNVQDPGNLGTIFRTAEAAGVTGVILSRDCADIYNPKTVRSTMGAVFRQPFVYVDNLPATISQMKERGIRVYAAHLQGERPYDREDYRKKTAFLIGNEGNGLRREVEEMADVRVCIPMAGRAESLNAGIAAGILMFEAARQRRNAGDA